MHSPQMQIEKETVTANPSYSMTWVECCCCCCCCTTRSTEDHQTRLVKWTLFLPGSPRVQYRPLPAAARTSSDVSMVPTDIPCYNNITGTSTCRCPFLPNTLVILLQRRAEPASAESVHRKHDPTHRSGQPLAASCVSTHHPPAPPPLNSHPCSIKQ